MKHLVLYCVIPAFCLACNSGPKSDAAIEKELSVTDVVDENMSGEQRSEEQHLSGSVTVDGKEYAYQIHRRSSDSLATVKGDYSANAVFHDNTATLTIMQGNRRILSRTYTKQSFSTLVDEDMMARSILKGLVFDRAIPGALQFAVAVGYPQDEDMYIPILLQVKPDGSVRMEKDPLMDSASDADINPDDSGKPDIISQGDPEV